LPVPTSLPIAGCTVVPAKANPDARGCLYEIFRQSWPGAFHAVQWNACVSKAGVVRGVHVHVDMDEYYTLLKGRALCGLHDLRRDSPTFGQSVTFDWTARDGRAVVIPRGIAHGFWFAEDSVLSFGLSDYYKPEYDVIGCQWDDPSLAFDMPADAVRSARDTAAGDYAGMVAHYERLLDQYRYSLAAV
jgi:dTDP-4-dehydrorhamnose 3,5-epimerase